MINLRYLLAITLFSSVITACGGGSSDIEVEAVPQLTLFAGSDSEDTKIACAQVDGEGSKARFSDIRNGITTDPKGNIYIAENSVCSFDNKTAYIRKIDTSGKVTTLAKGNSSNDDQPYTGFYHSVSILFNKDNDFYIGTGVEGGFSPSIYFPAFFYTKNGQSPGIWQVSNGESKSFAGISKPILLPPHGGYFGEGGLNGKGLEATFGGVDYLTKGKDNHIYAVDESRIRKISLEGDVSKIEDVNNISSLTSDSQGEVYAVNKNKQLINIFTKKIIVENIPMRQNNTNSDNLPAKVNINQKGELFATSNDAIYKLISNEWKPVLGEVNGKVYLRKMKDIRAVTIDNQNNIYFVDGFALYKLNGV